MKKFTSSLLILLATSVIGMAEAKSRQAGSPLADPMSGNGWGDENVSDSLRVEMMAFDGFAEEGGMVVLTWETSSEVNCEFFAIERSRDGKTWEEIDHVYGLGREDEVSQYEWMDNQPKAGTTWYRLRQTGYQGDIQYSERLSVEQEAPAVKMSVYPNPATNYLRVHQNENYYQSATLMDLKGQEVRSFRIATGVNTLSLTGLRAGQYILLFRDVSGELARQERIIKR